MFFLLFEQKLVQERIAALKADMGNDFATLNLETHKKIDSVIRNAKSNVQNSSNELMKLDNHVTKLMNERAENTRGTLELVANTEAQILEDVQQFVRKVQQDTFAEVDARIERAMKMLNQKHSKQVGYAFDRMDFKIKDMQESGGITRQGVLHIQ